MADVTLGSTPTGLTMWLVDAAPFAASVTATDPFPAAPDLLFGDGTTWPATLSGDALTATWVRTAEDVAALLVGKPRRVTLRDPATHTVWAHGTVYVTRVNPSDAPSALPPGGSITVDTLTGQAHITYTTEHVTHQTVEQHTTQVTYDGVILTDTGHGLFAMSTGTLAPAPDHPGLYTIGA